MAKGQSNFYRVLMVCLTVFGLFTISGTVIAAVPLRYATEVTDVFKAYTADEWIVAPEEEAAGEAEIGALEECDIRGVIACFDANFLRFDILLHHSITFNWKVWYGVKFQYTNMNEYLTYFPDTDTCIFEQEINGKIVKSVILNKDSFDVAGVTDSKSDDDSVYFIISKANHIRGVKGRRYFLTCSFFRVISLKKVVLNTLIGLYRLMWILSIKQHIGTA